MKKLIYLLFILSIPFIACKKEDPVPECELNDTGELQVQNLRNSTYDLYLNDMSYGDIGPDDIVLITAKTGSYTLKFYTNEGYYYKTIRIRQCKTERFTFDY